jgi:hypothetical protein
MKETFQGILKTEEFFPYKMLFANFKEIAKLNYHFLFISNSTLRFLAWPSVVALEAIGFDSPNPALFTRSVAIFFKTK